MRKALGKGLEALFPAAAEPRTALAAVPRELVVPIEEIVPNPEQPRRHFDEEALASLAESIRRHGLLQPLLVRRIAGRYELVAGERRLRAAARAGLAAVAVIVRESRPGERLELALIENLQRENLSALEEAEAYRHLLDTYGLTQDEIAERVGKTRPTISNALRLLGLPDAVKAQLESGTLSAGHARAVLSLESAEDQVDFAREITTRRLPKSEAERLVAVRRSRGRDRKVLAAASDIDIRGAAEDLTRGLGTRVRISRRARGGSIEIEFYSDAELDRLLTRLRPLAARPEGWEGAKDT